MVQLYLLRSVHLVGQSVCKLKRVCKLRPVIYRKKIKGLHYIACVLSVPANECVSVGCLRVLFALRTHLFSIVCVWVPVPMCMCVRCFPSHLTVGYGRATHISSVVIECVLLSVQSFRVVFFGHFLITTHSGGDSKCPFVTLWVLRIVFRRCIDIPKRIIYWFMLLCESESWKKKDSLDRTLARIPPIYHERLWLLSVIGTCNCVDG